MGKAARKAMRKATTRKAMRKSATGKAMGKAAKRRAGERKCRGRKHGTAEGSGGRQNEDGSIQHDKLLLHVIETIPFRSFT
jgi:hypothetical protein